MKIRNLLFVTTLAAGMAATQFVGAGSAQAIGGATGGVWKTTNFVTAGPSAQFALDACDDQGQPQNGAILSCRKTGGSNDGMWLPAPQKPREAAFAAK